MDYEQLLDDWAEEVLKRMDEIVERYKKVEYATHKYYRNTGFIDGLAFSLAIFNRLERQAKRKEANHATQNRNK